MKRIYLVFILSFIAYGEFTAQQKVGQWKTFTDMKSVRNAVIVGSKIWATTGGGVFTFDTLTGKFERFNNTDGLSSNEPFCITAESTNRIWVGQSNGYLDVLDLKTGVWKNFDVNRPGSYSRSVIKDLFIYGDTLYIALEFGIVPFKINKWEFGDVYATLGQLSAFNVNCVSATDNQIFVGTDKGLAVAPRKVINLPTPDPWTTYSSIHGLSTSIVTDLEVFRDTMIIATDKGAVYYTQNSLWIINQLLGASIQKLYVAHDTLFVLINEGSGFAVKSLSHISDIPKPVLSNSSVQAKTLIVSSSVWVGTSTKGLIRKEGSNWNNYYPNGPNSNSFSSIVVDEKGVLWAAPGVFQYTGFYRYDPSLPEEYQWKNFPKDSGAEGYYRMSLGTNGVVWAGSWGNGFTKVVNDSIQRYYNYYSSPSLPGIENNERHYKYVVAGSAAIDGAGNTWITNAVADQGKSVIRLDSDTNGTFFNNQYNNTGLFYFITIDRNNTKWLGGDLSWRITNKGLYVFNENPILQGITLRGNSSSGYWGYLSTADGLKSNAVLCFAIDLDGALWIGTSQGINIIYDPLYPKKMTPCYATENTALIVQAIAVDGMNNKWLGTNEGVFVVNADGTQLLKSYTVLSTKGMLIDNDVVSIAIDQKRGIAYFATSKGLSSLGIEPTMPNQSFSSLNLGPNPYIIPNEQPLTINGLVANSNIKILTVSGSVVNQFPAQGGGRAFWNGRDDKGRYVSSGIYFVIAYSNNGEQTAMGKVAIVRR